MLSFSIIKCHFRFILLKHQFEKWFLLLWDSLNKPSSLGPFGWLGPFGTRFEIYLARFKIYLLGLCHIDHLYALTKWLEAQLSLSNCQNILVLLFEATIHTQTTPGVIRQAGSISLESLAQYVNKMALVSVAIDGNVSASVSFAGSLLTANSTNLDVDNKSSWCF